MQFITKARRKAAEGIDKGFTLIELLITIVILGVLAGIVVFAVSSFTNDGKAEACKADIKNVEIALEADYAKRHTFAATPAAIVTDGYLKEAPSSSDYTITIHAADAAHANEPYVVGALTGDDTPSTDCS